MNKPYSGRSTSALSTASSRRLFGSPATTYTCQGCVFPPLGANRAVSKISCTVSNLTFVGKNCLRRRAIHLCANFENNFRSSRLSTRWQARAARVYNVPGWDPGFDRLHRHVSSTAVVQCQYRGGTLRLVFFLLVISRIWSWRPTMVTRKTLSCLQKIAHDSSFYSPAQAL